MNYILLNGGNICRIPNVVADARDGFAKWSLLPKGSSVEVMRPGLSFQHFLLLQSLVHWLHWDFHECNILCKCLFT